MEAKIATPIQKYVISMINNNLCYGLPEAAEYKLDINTYMSTNQASYGNRNFGYSVDKYTVPEECMKSANFCLKVDSNNESCIVFSKTIGWADFFIKKPRETHNDPDRINQIKTGAVPPDYLYNIKSIKLYIGPEKIVKTEPFIEYVNYEENEYVISSTKCGYLQIYSKKADLIKEKFLGEFIFKKAIFGNKGNYLIIEAINYKNEDFILFVEFEQIFNNPKYFCNIIVNKKGILFDKWIDENNGIYQLNSQEKYNKTLKLS